MCVPYKKTASKYYYKENLLGEWAKITLYLTHKTMRLYMISIDWSGPTKNRKSGFPDVVKNVLSEKKNISTRSNINKYQYSINFKLDQNNEANLSSSAAGTLLKYTDHQMVILSKREVDNLQDYKIKRGLEKDKHKF